MNSPPEPFDNKYGIRDITNFIGSDSMMKSRDDRFSPAMQLKDLSTSIGNPF